MLESGKFFSGSLVALSAMVSLEIPHVNVLTKMDLLSKRNKELVESFLDPDSHLFPEDDGSAWDRKHKQLTKSLARVVSGIIFHSFATNSFFRSTSLLLSISSVSSVIIKQFFCSSWKIIVSLHLLHSTTLMKNLSVIY